MRDPLKEPKYGDVFEWVNRRPVQPVVMYLCASAEATTDEALWTGLTLVTNGIKQPGEINKRWASLDADNARVLGAHWRVVEAAR